MRPLAATVTPEWLSLREPADQLARSRELVARLLPLLPQGEVVVHDLGSGTGSMTRWLAPQLPGPQHWVLHDVDETLLAHAAATACRPPHQDGAMTVSTVHGDATRIDARDLAGAALVTTSALLDLLTADEVTRIVTACVSAGCPSLFTLSVTGRVQLTPRHPFDAAIEAGFNAHQRRVVDGRRLLGPDAAAHASTAYRRLGAEVHVADTPWRLGGDHVDLVVEWLTGWVGAAVEQQPELAEPAHAYVAERVADAAAGRLAVSVGHADLLALPRSFRVEPRSDDVRVARGEG